MSPIITKVTVEGLVLPFLLDNISGTSIQKSSLHGFGLFATEQIKRETILCVLDGQIVSWDSYIKISSEKPFGKFNGDLFMEWNALDEETLLIRPYRTKYSFINHSRNPNTVLQRFPLALLALENLQIGEELTLDYRKEPLSQHYLQSANFL